MSMFIPLFKVDETQRLVYGRIDETPDRSGEIFDYPSSKPEFQSWSRDVATATDGKSLGNVRAMHGRVAAGKLEDIRFDDKARAIELCARIIDEDEWAKVESGVYTGFSPGGHYVKRWRDGDYTRYTARPVEISIVDLPCIPSASFTMVKGDGVAVEVPFLGAITGAGTPPPGSLPGTDDALAKALGELTGIRTELVRMTGENAVLKKRVLELESLPRPGGPVLKAVEKADDVPSSAGNGDEAIRIAALPDGAEKSLALIKRAHRHPMVRRF